MELKQKIRFCTPSQRVSSLVVDARPVPVIRGDVPAVMIDNPVLRGTCEAESDLYTPPMDAIAELANCRGDTDGVRRFTNRYGPLYVVENSHGHADRARAFAFQLSDWLQMQVQFRCTWDGFLGLDSRYPRVLIPYFKEAAPALFSEPWKSVQASGRFELTSKGLDFVADSLFATLTLVLIAVNERGLLRHCANPGCDEPYFIAAHPRQRYCTDKCAAWAQAQAKIAWWKEKGKEWLEQKIVKAPPITRTRKTTSKKGGKNVSKKAR